MLLNAIARGDGGPPAVPDSRKGVSAVGAMLRRAAQSGHPASRPQGATSANGGFSCRGAGCHGWRVGPVTRARRGGEAPWKGCCS
jgi:hypothetical protein